MLDRRQRSQGWLVGLSLALAFSGCKSVYWEDLQKNPPPMPAKQLARQKKPFLGVMTRKNAAQEGVKVVRVLKASPADLAGLKPDDVLKLLNGVPFENVDEFEKTLFSQWIDKKSKGVELIVQRGDTEQALTVKLTTFEAYDKERRRRTDSAARSKSRQVPAWPVMDYIVYDVDINTWREYFGVEVSDKVVIYRDMDFLPIFGLFSLYRVESTNIHSGSRHNVLFPYLGPSFVEEQDRYLDNIVAGDRDLLEY